MAQGHTQASLKMIVWSEPKVRWEYPGARLTTRSSQERGQGGPQRLYSASSMVLQLVTGRIGGAESMLETMACLPRLCPSLFLFAPRPTSPSVGTWAWLSLAGLPLGLRSLTEIPQALRRWLVTGSGPASQASSTAPTTVRPGAPRTPVP